MGQQAGKPGKVYIVGAGPGDIGLLTIKGLRCLQAAEVVVYDFHLNAQILNYINHDAEFIYAGKRGGRHEMTQDEINHAILSKALEGKTVCRLKGGDPFVFGRGGEEAEVLAAKGVEFEIVPGVSSAIAAPAYAGIPLTHRGYSSSFAVITGNEAATKPMSTIDWSTCARTYDTLVFLMAVKNMSAIISRLIENGKSPETPTAVVRWGTRPDQKTVVGTLGTIAGLIRDQNISPPAVMVTGNVVSLREKLHWYEKKPLFGHRILITREYTADYAPLETLGAEIFEFPTIEITPPRDFSELDRAITGIGDYHWLIVTSANGWHYFLERLLDTGGDIRDLKGLRICAIGKKTAAAVTGRGVKVDLVPEEFNAEGLVEAFVKMYGEEGFRGLKLLLPRAEKAREVFPEMVRSRGGDIDTPTAYRATKPEKHAKRLIRFLKEGRITIVTFTSALNFNHFIEIVGDGVLEFLRRTAIGVIGPVTARAVQKAGFEVAIMPSEATMEALVDEIVMWCGKSHTASK
jgi:uroporphyrinogen III methyltransferase / synthase